jgi:hypothetical protein
MEATRSGHTAPVARLAVIGAVGAALAFAGGTASGAPTKPVLKLVRTAPLTVRGTHFYARERVRVTVDASRRFVRTVRTSAAGAFTATFDNASLVFDRCGNNWIISARGAGGDAAMLKLPQPDCPPSLGP